MFCCSFVTNSYISSFTGKRKRPDEAPPITSRQTRAANARDEANFDRELRAVLLQSAQSAQDNRTEMTVLEQTIAESETSNRIREGQVSELLSRAQTCAGHYGCKLIDIARDGNCLPAAISAVSKQGCHVSVRQALHELLTKAFEQNESWTHGLLASDYTSFEQLSVSGSLAHVQAAAILYGKHIRVLNVGMHMVESPAEPVCGVISPTPWSSMHTLTWDWTLIFDGEAHWYAAEELEGALFHR